MRNKSVIKVAALSLLITSCAVLQNSDKQYSLGNDEIYLKLDYEPTIDLSSFDVLGNEEEFSFDSILNEIPKPTNSADSLEYMQVLKSLDSMKQVMEVTTIEWTKRMDSLKLTDTYKNADFSQPYYIFRDSSFTVSDYGTELIYPKKFMYKRWFKNKKDSSFYGQSQTGENQLAKLNPKNQITIDKSKRKTINDIEGIHYKIIQIFQSSYYGEASIVNEGYFNPKFDIPFNNYIFLELKGALDLNGLILENKNYTVDSSGKSGSSNVTLKRLTKYDKSTFSFKEFITNKYGNHITNLQPYD